MENPSILVKKVNKEMENLENDISALADWHETHHKSIGGIHWKELDKVQELIKKIKKYIKKK